jgi:hypothetical protein
MEFNFPGYITRGDLINLVLQNYLLPKGALLNGNVTMDGENHYVQF